MTKCIIAQCLYFTLPFQDWIDRVWLGGRLGSCAMRSGKPALVLTSAFDLWIGNQTDAQVNVAPGELFGFSTGSYEEVRVDCAWVILMFVELPNQGLHFLMCKPLGFCLIPSAWLSTFQSSLALSPTPLGKI